MTSKLKCPFCLQELKKNESGAYYCTTKWCDLWGVIISKCAAEHFTQTTQDMLNTAKMLATTEKDLEIARKALESISGVRGNIEDYYGGVSIHYQQMVLHMDEIATNALEQINHIADVSKMIEHKE